MYHIVIRRQDRRDNGWNRAYRKFMANVDLTTGEPIPAYGPVVFENPTRPARSNIEVGFPGMAGTRTSGHPGRQAEMNSRTHQGPPGNRSSLLRQDFARQDRRWMGAWGLHSNVMAMSQT
jgi:hypothetical protein